MFKALLLAFKHRHRIKAFLPIIEALFALLQQNNVMATQLQRRPETNRVKDLRDLVETADKDNRLSKLSDRELTEKVFKL